MKSNAELIAQASERLNPHLSGDRLFGNVAAVIVAESGSEFEGVCIDTGSGTGFCAEAAAIAAMVTAREYRLQRIVSVWRKEETDELFMLPPCGRCREFIRQIDEHNLDTEVILGEDKVIPLRDLLPHHEWPDPVLQTTPVEVTGAVVADPPL